MPPSTDQASTASPAWDHSVGYRARALLTWLRTHREFVKCTGAYGAELARVLYAVAAAPTLLLAAVHIELAAVITLAQPGHSCP